MVEHVGESTHTADYFVTDQLGSKRGFTNQARTCHRPGRRQPSWPGGRPKSREGVRAEVAIVADTPKEPISKDQVRNLVLLAREITCVLAQTDPDLKEDLYAELGVQISYDPIQRVITPTASPCTKVRIGGSRALSGTAHWRLRPMARRRGPVKAGRRPPEGAALTGPGWTWGLWRWSRRRRLLEAPPPPSVSRRSALNRRAPEPHICHTHGIGQTACPRETTGSNAQP